MNFFGRFVKVGQRVKRLRFFRKHSECVGEKWRRVEARFCMQRLLVVRRTIIEGLRAVPVQVDIKVVPVQDERQSIESVDASEKPPLAFEPDVKQG